MFAKAIPWQSGLECLRSNRQLVLLRRSLITPRKPLLPHDAVLSLIIAVLLFVSRPEFCLVDFTGQTEHGYVTANLKN